MGPQRVGAVLNPGAASMHKTKNADFRTGWPPFYDRDFQRMCLKILRKPLRFHAQRDGQKLPTVAQAFIRYAVRAGR